MSDTAPFAYVVPKSIHRQFVLIADLRTQVGGIIYGTSPADNSVKKTRCIIMPPQVGSHQRVTLPTQMPDHEMIEGVEPLGWIHSQPTELSQLSPNDVITTAKMMADNKEFGGDRTVVKTVAFTPGSCSLSAYKLSPTGYEWGCNHRDADATMAVPTGYSSSHFEKVLVELPGTNFLNQRDQFHILESKWYHWWRCFQGRKSTRISHRTKHFLDFAANQEDEMAIADQEDFFN